MLNKKDDDRGGTKRRETKSTSRLVRFVLSQEDNCT